MRAMADVATSVKLLLIVEDDSTVQRVLRIAMRHAGFDVEVVDSGRAAVARLERGGIAGVLLDLGLPDGRANDVLDWLHAHEEQPPWLVISAMDRSDVARMDGKIPARFIAKPFDPWTLIERVKAMTAVQGE